MQCTKRLARFENIVNFFLARLGGKYLRSVISVNSTKFCSTSRLCGSVGMDGKESTNNIVRCVRTF